MSESIKDLERDIEETRARLDLTIDRIQDKMSVSGIVDDVMGSVNRSQYATVMDRALVAVRENPVPVLLMVAGLGWLIHRMSRTDRGRVRVYRVYEPSDPDYLDEFGEPALRTRAERGYDPDTTSVHPNADVLEPRRTTDARA